jgi:RHS repeat-associated protein
MVIPGGETGAGTYLVTWNGHGDALALWQINTGTGALTLANSYTYTTWGTPTTSTHNSIPDLGFRFLYVGAHDVQWDNAYLLGLHYMHARHYSPLIGRFLQPDPTAQEANLYAYAANSPITEMDPDGTCFILCGVINAIADTAIYLATTDRSQWSWGGVAGAAAFGFGTGVIGAGIVSKIAKIGAVSRAVSRVGQAAKTIANKVNHNDWVRIGRGPVRNAHIRPRYWEPGTTAGEVRYPLRISIGNNTSSIRGHIHRWNIMEGAFGRYGWFQRFSPQRFPIPVPYLPPQPRRAD